MELHPKSENGIRLHTLLESWTKSSYLEMDKVKRLLIMFASKVVNADSFIAAMYGQKVLDETPLSLVSEQKYLVC